MAKVYRFLLILLSIATGGLFLYSAWTKLFPIESFEYTMTQYTHMPLLIAKIAARFFIGLEAGLGALMVFHFFGKSKWPLKAAFALVAIFSIYLIYLWIVAGNNVNCGCFGDAIWMRPSSSLIKNGIILVVLGILIKYHRGFAYKWTKITAPILLAAVITTGYIVFPVYAIYKIDLKPLYTSDPTLAPSIDLTKGKHILAFLSPSCGHCRKAGLMMHDMYVKNPNIPFYFVIGGIESDLTEFWKATKAEDMPHTRLAREPFMKITKGIFPQIWWVNNSMVEEDINYPDMNQQLIEKWMK
jgi:hypothetical protein